MTPAQQAQVAYCRQMIRDLRAEMAANGYAAAAIRAAFREERDECEGNK